MPPFLQVSVDGYGRVRYGSASNDGSNVAYQKYLRCKRAGGVEPRQEEEQGGDCRV